MWYVYLLANFDGRTYIGATTNPARRERQHNGEIVGGARSTSRYRPWIMYCYLSGFQTKSEAYRWEKLLKTRARGFDARLQSFQEVSSGKCPPYKRRKQYQVPGGLRLVLTVGGKNA